MLPVLLLREDIYLLTIVRPGSRQVLLWGCLRIFWEKYANACDVRFRLREAHNSIYPLECIINRLCHKGHFPEKFHSEGLFQEMQLRCVFFAQKERISFYPLIVADNHIACVKFSYKIWVFPCFNPVNSFTYHTVIHADSPPC